MASDDHFQVVELAAEWMRGNPVFLDGQERFYRTLLYPGFHWAVMSSCHAMGFFHPDAVMTIVRLFLGAYSLWSVAIVYRYGEAIGGRPVAWTAGWLAAAHALLPYAGVRSLVEMAALPLLIYGLYRLHLAVTRAPARAAVNALLAGLAFGGAVVLRVQVATAAVGIAAYLLWRRRPATLLWWFVGAAVPIALQGIWDLSLYGTFLGSAAKYVEFNRENLHGYVVGPVYRYVLTIIGAFLPPFGLIFFLSIFRRIRDQGVLFWATAAFLLVHSVIPQKQERFLLPVLPAVILMGTFGLHAWVRDAGPTFRRWIRYGWRFFWAVNAPLVLVAIFHYGQKARIEPLVYLYERGGTEGIVLDLTEEKPGIPRYYLDGGRADRKPPVFYAVRAPEDLGRLRARLAPPRPAAPSGEGTSPGEEAKDIPPVLPEYVLIFSRGRIREHVDRISRELAGVAIVYHSSPHPIDRVLRALQPNRNRSKESWLGLLQWPTG
jgi:hypothetical protein